jgi:hypothetical protein
MVCCMMLLLLLLARSLTELGKCTALFYSMFSADQSATIGNMNKRCRGVRRCALKGQQFVN